MNRTRLGIVLVASVGLVQSQTITPATKPKFEVASIKPCMDSDHPPPGKSSPGRLSLTCKPLTLLIQEAYDIFATGKVNPLNPQAPLTPIEGQPDWLNISRYTIEARSEQPQTVPMMRGPMMRALLEERFQLRVHHETRMVPVYALMVDKNGPGPQLQSTKEGTCVSATDEDMLTPRIFTHGEVWCGNPRITRKEDLTIYDVRGMSLEVFVKFLRFDRPVIDRTGLTGTFDLHMEWLPDPPDLPRQSSVDAMRKMLGLRLVSDKGPIEVLVVDHVAKPSEN